MLSNLPSSPPTWIIEQVGLWGVLLATALPLAAQTTAPPSIPMDTQWSGTITVTSDVRILGATVRVESGSIIRFVGPTSGKQGPALRLSGSGDGVAGRQTPARLILAGTADHPIVVETPPGNRPGAIIGNAMVGCSISATHVIFRRCGPPASAQRCEPGLFALLTSTESDLSLADCRFEQCGPVHAEFIGAGATAEIHHCTFAETVGDSALVLIGTGDGLRVITDNVAAAGFEVECPQVLLRDNVLVGESAAIVARHPAGNDIDITSNYVHCTSHRDEGRYALKCHAARAVVSRNVLLGGTYVIETAPATLTGNVLVGAGNLDARPSVPGLETRGMGPASSHYLVANVPPSATLTDNLLLGPAYAALAVGPAALGPRIENNLFDGWGSARQALAFNPLNLPAKNGPLAAVFKHNVVVRYRSSPISDRSGHPGDLAEVSSNLFAEVPEPLYGTIPDAPAASPPDRRLATLADLELKAPAATQSAADLEEQLLRRQVTVARVREAWFGAYQPHPGSPLITPAGTIGPRVR